MARVVFTTGISNQYTGGETEFVIEANNVRRLMAEIEAKFPGLRAVLEQETSIAIDGEVFPDAFLEPIKADSEIFFLPKIGGG